MKRLRFADKITKELENPSYRKLNLASNPFLPYIPLNISATFVNREKEQDIMVRYISSLLTNAIDGVIILGSKCIGKTHFIKYMQQEIKPLSRRLGIKLFYVDDNTAFKDYISENAIPHSDIHFLFLDNLEEIIQQNKQIIYNMLSGGIERVKVIAACNRRAWRGLKRDMFGREIKISTLVLSELSDFHLVEMVEKRINEKVDGESPFSKQSLERLAHYSKGVPYSMVNYCEKILHFCLDKKYDKITPRIVDEFMNTLSIKKIDMLGITEMQREVLRKLFDMTSSYKRGISANEIAEEMGKARPTIFEHLRLLKEKGIVEGYKSPEDKKMVLYHIHPKLLQEVERFLELVDEFDIDNEITKEIEEELKNER